MSNDNPVIAYISVDDARDVADFLDRMIPTNCPLPNVKGWEEVRDALYALANDTDQIQSKEHTCTACNDKRYLISTRDDGKRAVERCDECGWFGEGDFRNITDQDAAKMAQRDGVQCADTYPCYLEE